MARTKQTARKSKAPKDNKAADNKAVEKKVADVKASETADVKAADNKAADNKAAASQPAAAIQPAPYVSRSQASKALEELKKYIERTVSSEASGKSDLFAEDNDRHVKPVYVNVELKKYAHKKVQLKPKLIALDKPYLKAAKNLKTCLFVRDNIITSAEQLEEIENANVPTLSKIVTLKELKTVYNPFDKRTQLRDEYDLFVVDDAILNSMPSTLGKTFYESPKYPVQVRIAANNATKVFSLDTLKQSLKKVLSSTTYIQPVATKAVIGVGKVGAELSDEDLLDNVLQVLRTFPREVVLTVGLSVAGSPVLPLFYADKLYDEFDVLENVKAEDDALASETTEDMYSKALLELADEETVTQVIGKKLKEQGKKSKKSKKSKQNGVSKP